MRPCGCGFRHYYDCELRQKSRAKFKPGAYFASPQELYDWLMTKPSIWEGAMIGSSGAIPCAFVASQPYRTVMNRYQYGGYRKVEAI